MPRAGPQRPQACYPLRGSHAASTKYRQRSVQKLQSLIGRKEKKTECRKKRLLDGFARRCIPPGDLERQLWESVTRQRLSCTLPHLKLSVSFRQANCRKFFRARFGIVVPIVYIRWTFHQATRWHLRPSLSGRRWIQCRSSKQIQRF
jgi:hypothetical protein